VSVLAHGSEVVVTDDVPVRRRVLVSSVAATALAVAGSLHLLAGIAHVPVATTVGHHGFNSATADGHWGAAVVLALIGVLQIGLAGAQWTTPTRPVVIVTIAFTALTLTLYVISRTSGLPFGPDSGRPEQVELFDLSVAALEVCVVVALATCLPEPVRGRVTTVLMLGGVALIAGRLVGVLAA
jgi:hypothetical protein